MVIVDWAVVNDNGVVAVNHITEATPCLIRERVTSVSQGCTVRHRSQSRTNQVFTKERAMIVSKGYQSKRSKPVSKKI